MTAPSDEEDRSAVEAANEAFYHAYEAGDLDAMRAVWADEEGCVCVHPGNSPLLGRERIGTAWAVLMASTPYIQFFLTDLRVSVHGDVASASCTENILIADESTAPDSFGGGRAVATNVFVRTSSGWRLWIHHASPVLSP